MKGLWNGDKGALNDSGNTLLDNGELHKGDAMVLWTMSIKDDGESLKCNGRALNGDGETSKSNEKALKTEKSVKSDVDAIKFAGEALIGTADALNSDVNVLKGNGVKWLWECVKWRWEV